MFALRLVYPTPFVVPPTHVYGAAALLELLDRGDGGSTLFRNVGSSSQVDTV